MTIRHLKIFVMVCQEKSITKAGKKLFMAQPTVSVAISELEKHYNIQLFDRISKKLYLTEAGSRLLPYAQHMVALFEEMEMGAQAWGGAQLLHIGASVTIGNCLLPDYLKRLKCVHPEIQVKAEVNNSEKLEQGILEIR